MAHDNLENRRAFVLNRIKTGVTITPSERKEIAAVFGCSSSAVYSDIIKATVDFQGFTWHVNLERRERVKERDEGICQYCGENAIDDLNVEHVVPYLHGGVGREYNLVISCTPCNLRKRSRVWIPMNLEKITEKNLEWREKIKLMAVADHGISRPSKKRSQRLRALA